MAGGWRFDPPTNVAVQARSFEGLADRICGCFDFPVSLDGPYEACDFRPAFGEIFAAELDGYDFCGLSRSSWPCSC